MHYYLYKRHWIKLLFFCFWAALFTLLPNFSTATHQYYCAGVTYADSQCAISSTFSSDWQGCFDSDQTGKCIQDVSETPAGIALFFQKAEFCSPRSETCGHSITPSLPSQTPLTVDITAFPDSILAGESSILSWETSDAAVTCVASGAWSGEKPLFFKTEVKPQVTSTYTLTCTGSGGSGSDSVTITVVSPTQTQIPTVISPTQTQTPEKETTSQTETISQNVSAGGTVTTDTEGDGTTTFDSIETSVTSPVGGQITINERPATRSAPAGFSYLPVQVVISAPLVHQTDPLVISFQLHQSLLPPGIAANALRVFKDNNPVANCPDDPCVFNISVSGDHIAVIVHTSSASIWNLGFAQASGGLVQCGRAGQDPCGLCDIFVLGKTIIDQVMFFVPIVGALFLVIGGFLFFIGGADPSKVNQGNSVIKATVIGIVIIYASWLFISFLLTFLGVASWTGLGGWWEITC